jgi:predicted DNA-binding helix-hairpin-helix protein
MVEELRQRSEATSCQQHTEFVVGPAGERDVELLSATEYLHNQLKLARVYFSAFHPVSDTPLDNVAPTTEQRKLRLYQASFLLRDYDFTVEELPFVGEGDLPQHTDPKHAWAEENLAHAPVEINTASQRDLIRFPGIGITYARRIMAARRREPTQPQRSARVGYTYRKRMHRMYCSLAGVLISRDCSNWQLRSRCPNSIHVRDWHLRRRVC